MSYHCTHSSQYVSALSLESGGRAGAVPESELVVVFVLAGVLGCGAVLTENRSVPGGKPCVSSVAVLVTLLSSCNNVRVHDSVLKHPKEHLSPPLDALVKKAVVAGKLIQLVNTKHVLIVVVDDYWLQLHLSGSTWYICVCVCVCVCMRAYMCACVWGGACVCERENQPE